MLMRAVRASQTIYRNYYTGGASGNVMVRYHNVEVMSCNDLFRDLSNRGVEL